MQSTFLWTLSHLHTDLSGLLRVYGFVMGLQIAAGCCNRTGAEWQNQQWIGDVDIARNSWTGIFPCRYTWKSAKQTRCEQEILIFANKNYLLWLKMNVVETKVLACVSVSTSTLNSATAIAWNPDLDPIRTWIVNNRIGAAFRDKVIVVDLCRKVNILILKFNYTR